MLRAMTSSIKAPTDASHAMVDTAALLLQLARVALLLKTVYA